ncbi:stringent starvation protein B [Psychromonas marina]|uniref:Stringent starvation protein B n=1 Tax=Psychromonas marina TaxID=88364 RepID=A0ABQ6E3W9_9GAMM|nr:ClpXP protease specificity-enhancing factor [Psychromonas marina]GLS92149.1 stringent starvation protein B [Psychromonas marina]
MSSMLVQRPYLLKAFFNWIVDSECTPHIIVDATQPCVEVPEQFVEDGKIVLNIAPRSVMQFSMDDDAVAFNARFSGQPMQVYVPLYAIEGIYARENGAGTMFPEEPAYQALDKEVQPEKEVEVAEKPIAKNRAGLKIVK